MTEQEMKTAFSNCNTIEDIQEMQDLIKDDPTIFTAEEGMMYCALGAIRTLELLSKALEEGDL